MKIIAYYSGAVPSDVYAAVSDVLFDAFQERTQQGITFDCASYSVQDIDNQLDAGCY